MNNKINKYLASILILIAGIVASWLVIVARPAPAPEDHHEAPPHLAEVITVALEDRSITVASQGTVTPGTEISMTSQVSGEVVSVSKNFTAGGFFTAEQTLLQIDTSDYEIALARAQASLAEARNQLAQEQGLAAQAKREWRDLGSVAANELFLRKPQVEAAQANVNATQAGVRKAGLDLERCRISLPFDGRVSSINANLGQFINSGATLGSVYASEPLEVRLPLTASELRLLNLGAAMQTPEMPSLQVDFSLGVGSDTLHWSGEVVRLEAGVDPKNRLYHLVAEIHNVGVDTLGQPANSGTNPILPGTFVEASITSNPHHNVVVLPRSALYQRSQVMLLDHESRLRLRAVTVLQVDAETLIVSGLEDGQRVLARPPGYMDMGEVYTAVNFASAESVE